MKQTLLAVLLLGSSYTLKAQETSNRSESFLRPEIKPAIAKDSVIRICTPSRAGIIKNKPLYVIFSDRKHFIANETVFREVKPEIIKTINVLKDEAAIKKYGESARNGVIEIYIDVKKYPKVYRELKMQAKSKEGSNKMAG